MKPGSQPEVDVHVTAGAHPFWTGQQRLVAAGRVEKFHRRYGRRERRGGER
ncbi:ribosomal protein L31 [Goodfellowiella coeruleoviolacea]|uniref:50S ribosomal protein L31 n=1 Tax=Goodfellowiella coeruleoviolacea TaxID=334858 RepID=A0AAE3GJV6_9PSEU|nr:50S ribosomal protein L31 [Goodfellowiella coeruleoviolacea]MCP2168674.1 ribosomal protein L31 [Goodfellowiella coeruleoviolacea]